MYVSAGAHRPYVHARKLRETPTRHVYPLPFERKSKARSAALTYCGDWRRVADACVQTPSSRYFEGGSVCLQRSPKRERHACPGAVLESRMHAYSVYSAEVFFLMNGKKSTSLWICHVYISQRGTSFSSGTPTL